MMETSPPLPLVVTHLLMQWLVSWSATVGASASTEILLAQRAAAQG